MLRYGKIHTSPIACHIIPYTYLQTVPEYRKAGNVYEPYYSKLKKIKFTPYQHKLTIISNNSNSKTKKLIFTLTQTVGYEIYQSRNKIKYDNIILSNQTIINKINKQMQAIVNVHYKKHKARNTLDKSQQHFL